MSEKDIDAKINSHMLAINCELGKIKFLTMIDGDRMSLPLLKYFAAMQSVYNKYLADCDNENHTICSESGVIFDKSGALVDII